MHMKIVGKKFIQMLDIHKPLTDELLLEFKEDGIYSSSTDPCHYSSVSTVLKAKVCDEYTIRETGELQIGIEIKKLRDFLQLGTVKDVFTIDYDKENNKLVLRLGNLTRTMGLIDPDSFIKPEIPPIQLENSFTVSPKTFYEKLKGIMPDGEKFMVVTLITIRRESVTFEDYGSDEEKKNVIDRDVAISCQRPSYIMLDGLLLKSQLNEYRKLFEQIVFEMKDYGTPHRITGESDDLKVEYWLAPRIENEHEEHDMTMQKRQELLEHGMTFQSDIPEPITPEVPLEVPVLVVKPGVNTEKTPSNPPKKRSLKPTEDMIGCLVIIKTKTGIIGKITGITKTGYLIFFKGQQSKTLKDPIEIDRDLVEIYQKEKGGE